MLTTTHNHIKNYQKQGLLNAKAAENAISRDMPQMDLLDVHREYIIDAMVLLNQRIGAMVRNKPSGDYIRQTIKGCLDTAERELGLRSVKVYRSTQDVYMLTCYLIDCMLCRPNSTTLAKLAEHGVTPDFQYAHLHLYPEVLFDESKIPTSLEHHKQDCKYGNGNLYRMFPSTVAEYKRVNHVDFDVCDTDLVYGIPAFDNEFMCMFVIRHTPINDNEYFLPYGPADECAVEFYHVAEKWSECVDGLRAFMALQDMFGRTLAVRHEMMSKAPTYGMLDLVRASCERTVVAISKANPLVQYVAATTDVGECVPPDDLRVNFKERLCREVLSSSSIADQDMLLKYIHYTDACNGAVGRDLIALGDADKQRIMDLCRSMDLTYQDLMNLWEVFVADVRALGMAAGWK